MKNEPVDVLDEYGNQIGKVLPKREVHEQGLWHGGAHLWIYNSKGEVFLQHRDPNKEIYPDAWDISCAGHIDAGETPRQTLVREAQEELGLDLDDQKLKYIGVTFVEDRMPPGWVHRVFDWTYITKMDFDLHQLKLEEGETTDAKWMSLDDFEADINDDERIKMYSPRHRYVYQMAITEMRSHLNR